MALVAIAASLAGCGGSHQASGTRPSTAPSSSSSSGSIVVEGHTWHCRTQVDLTLVRVVLHGESADAVHLDRGCKGTIRRLEIVGNGAALGPGGDGVKVHDGAHDLRVLGGFIDCGAKRHGKHQDAIQAMGGRDVSFERITSRYCSNSFMFVNSGAHRRGLPTAIQCLSCTAATRNYSIFVGRSVDSGARGGRFSSRVAPRTTALAVRPVLEHDAWAPRPRS